MNAPILQALVLDAWQQVLDNKVFRLLVGVAILLVAPTFLIGFHSTHVEFLWGLGSISYADMVSLLPAEFQGITGQIEEPGIRLIQILQDLIVSSFAGTLGVVLAIAATSFFVPRMLERGAADTLFSKPVPRWALLASRYVSGLLFVAVLSFLLVLGMYLGFRVTSGYDDPGFLWSALTLVYLYSALHAFSLLVATLTRSSVAAILLTIVLFSFSGCVHAAWVQKEQVENDQRFQTILAASALREAALEEARTSAADTGSAEGGEAASTASEETGGVILERLKLALDVLHYVLPKTNDASVLIRKLKRSFEPMFALEDPAGQLVIEHRLRGWTLTSPGKRDLAASPAVWVPADGDLTSPYSLRLARRSRLVEEGGRTRTRTTLSMASELLEELRRDPAVRDAAREPLRLAGTQAHLVSWKLGEGEATLQRERWLFGYRDWVFELDATLPDLPPGQEDNDRWRRDLRRHLELGEDAGLQGSFWYERQFTLDAPWRYNPLFSIGSTLLFTLTSLLLAAWKLRRIDF